MPAVNAYALELQFTIDAKVTFAKEVKINYSRILSAEDVKVNKSFGKDRN